MSFGRTYFKWSTDIPYQLEYRFKFKGDSCDGLSYINFIDDEQIVIPKNLVFVWIGEQIPTYAKFAMQSFKKANPDFNIVLKHIVDWDSSNDKHVNYVKTGIKNKNGFFGKFYVRSFFSKFHKLGSKVDKNVMYSDMLRFSVLNDIGGIYLDCDTFPNKPFDDDLLKHNFFVGYDTLSSKHWEDIYMFGMKPNTISLTDFISDDYACGDFDIWKIFKSPYFNYNIVNNFNLYKCSNYNTFIKKFYDCDLEYKLNGFNNWDSYIAHFFKRSWNLNLIPNSMCIADVKLT